MWNIIYLGRWSLCEPLEGCWDFLWEASWLTWRRDTGAEEGRIFGGDESRTPATWLQSRLQGERPRERALCEGLFWRNSGFLTWKSLLFRAGLPFCVTLTTLHPTFPPRALSWRAERNTSLGAACWVCRGWVCLWKGRAQQKRLESSGRWCWEAREAEREPRVRIMRGQKANPLVSICPYLEVFKYIREGTELLYPIHSRDSN